MGQPLGLSANPEAVAAVKSGQRKEANAAWWGFDQEDATAALQGAIDSGTPKVVVPNVGKDWIVRPIRLRRDLELVFESGVVVLAKQGEFKGKGDSLFSASNASDIVLRGPGATLRMRKQDYASPEYAKAEWRMVLNLTGCTRVRVEGLRLESSGGDGIYLGSTPQQPYCEDVVIRDVACHDNYRQGISVISAVNLLVEDTTMSATSGTPPEAGIDFEPNHPAERLENCVLRNCTMEANHGAGILIYLRPLTRASAPVSIRVENCRIRSGEDTGIGVGAVGDDGPRGLIEFKDCTVENTKRGGIYVYDKSADSARVRFIHCTWRNAVAAFPTGRDEKGNPHVPLLVGQRRASVSRRVGGIDFVDCHVYDDVDRPVLVVEEKEKDAGVYDLKGRVVAHNPYGGRAELPAKTVDVSLEVVAGQ
jgi:hypothetical protein